MEELIKKLVYTGVGIAAFTAEKIKDVVDKLVSEEKLTSEEGKKIVDEFLKSAEEKKDEFEAQFKTVADKLASNVKFTFNNDSEVEELKARIAELEAASKTPEETK